MINIGQTTVGINVDAVEARYNCTYIGDFCLKTVGGGWCEAPAAIFYQPDPNRDLGHTNYMGVFERYGHIYLTCGDSAFSGPIIGVVADDGEIVYSRFRHDYRTSSDGSVFIDGGRDYVRRGLNDKTVQLEMVDGELRVVQQEKEVKEVRYKDGTTKRT